MGGTRKEEEISILSPVVKYLYENGHGVEEIGAICEADADVIKLVLEDIRLSEGSEWKPEKRFHLDEESMKHAAEVERFRIIYTMLGYNYLIPAGFRELGLADNHGMKEQYEKMYFMARLALIRYETDLKNYVSLSAEEKLKEIGYEPGEALKELLELRGYQRKKIREIPRPLVTEEVLDAIDKMLEAYIMIYARFLQTGEAWQEIAAMVFPDRISLTLCVAILTAVEPEMKDFMEERRQAITECLRKEGKLSEDRIEEICRIEASA